MPANQPARARWLASTVYKGWAHLICRSLSPLFIPLNNVLQDLGKELPLRFHPTTNFVEPDQQVWVTERKEEGRNQKRSLWFLPASPLSTSQSWMIKGLNKFLTEYRAVYKTLISIGFELASYRWVNMHYSPVICPQKCPVLQNKDLILSKGAHHLHFTNIWEKCKLGSRKPDNSTSINNARGLFISNLNAVLLQQFVWIQLTTLNM